MRYINSPNYRQNVQHPIRLPLHRGRPRPVFRFIPKSHQLGDWGDIATAVLKTGASVYGAEESSRAQVKAIEAQTAQVIAQINAQKELVQAQTAARNAQATAASAQYGPVVGAATNAANSVFAPVAPSGISGNTLIYAGAGFVALLAIMVIARR